MQALARRIEANWYRHPWHNLWLWPLLPLVALVVWYKRWAYLRYAKKPDVPVVVVGNITVGGTGKTPLITYLVSQAQAQGLNVAVVSRGYGGKAKHYPLVLGPSTPVEAAGDEPYLLYHRLNCTVVVAPKRAEAVAAAKALGAELVFSDDGLQHYAMNRSAEILVVDGKRRFGNGWLLPVGPLREPASRAQSVDLIMVNGDDFTVQPTALINACTGEQVALEELSGQRLQAVCGIGNPQRFVQSLESLGAKAELYAFADHHAFSAQDFSFNTGQRLVMTEKDWVKCQHFAQPNWWYLRVDAQLSSSSQQAVAHLLNRLTKA